MSVGATCEISASFVSENRTQLKKLSVMCGKAELYATDEIVNGSTRTLWAIGEKAVSGGFQQALVYEDTGKRQGRNQLSIDTPQGVARVWAADDTPLEVVLAVDGLGTVFPKAITPDAPSGLCAHVIRSGTVTEVAGDERRGVKPGVRCQVSESLGIDAIGLEMGPEGLGVDTQCRVRVSCGGTDLYAPGLGRGLGQVVGNEIVDQKPSAKDKDPMFRIAGDSVEVWDEGVSTWSVKIRLE